MPQYKIPFAACRNNNELINIGSNVLKIIGNHINTIDKINNNQLMTKKQKKREGYI